MKILLVVYDNGSYMTRFPIGLGYIASTLENNGYEVEIYSQDMHHYPDEHLTEYLDRNHFDAVGVSVIGGYYQYRKLMGLSKAINGSKDRPFYIIGGHGPSPEPEYFLKKTKADAIVIGEGEETILDLLSALKHKTSLDNVNGIAFRAGDIVKINSRRPLIENIDSIPFPAYHLFPMNYYRLATQVNSSPTDFTLPILSGRGCKFNCNFCYRMDKGIRIRSNESIIEEISMLKSNYRINYVVFYDELLMISEERTISLSEALIKANLGVKWFCSGRLNYAKPEVIRIMKESGCMYINYGIECFDDQILKNMNKSLTTKQIVYGIENTLKEGVTPGLNIIFGNIGENKDTLKKSLDFLVKYSDWAEMRTIRPVTPYPGSPLYYYAIKKGLLKDVEDFYENKHVNSDLLSVNFTNLTDDEFHNFLLEANAVLIKKYFEHREQKCIKDAEDLYKGGNNNFRGFRQT
jgi:radical SAM superfamily enzyme YgiQ (UPF0313 family)